MPLSLPPLLVVDFTSDIPITTAVRNDGTYEVTEAISALQPVQNDGQKLVR